jgi:hypothetical protein
MLYNKSVQVVISAELEMDEKSNREEVALITKATCQQSQRKERK